MNRPFLQQIVPLVACCVAITSLHLAGAVQDPSTVAPWIGIGYAVQEDASEIRVVSLPYGSPAESAGLEIGDRIVAIDGMDLNIGDDLESFFVQTIQEREIGDQVTLQVRRRTAPALLDITVELQRRPAALGQTREFGSFEDLERDLPKVSRGVEQLTSDLIEEFDLTGAYQDLRERLARLSRQGDRFRLSRVAYIQTEPFQLQTMAEALLDGIRSSTEGPDPGSSFQTAAQWLDAEISPPPRLATGLGWSAHLEQLTGLLGDVAAHRRQAFSELSGADREFLAQNIDGLFQTFAGRIDIQADLDRERWRRNTRVLELTEQVDFESLFRGAALLSSVTDARYLNDLESALRAAWEEAGRPEGIFIDEVSRVGRIVAGGPGNGWYSQDAAVLLDLGGDDFYTNNSGSPRGDEYPATLLVDFGGADAHEATTDWTQSAAVMGYGLLIDRNGDDRYLAQDWSQGAAVLGVSLFVDESGDDVYRSQQYTQGAAAWGIALHIDRSGNDQYNAGQLAQGVGMAGGAGWLLNARGDDQYYAKGARPTEYGDPGIFDSWSQGTAVGFRGLHSGGVALLYDGGGRDQYEAGNFSQGGGYYFGIGFLSDDGSGDDTYTGSRYNQGWAAHQAIGYFDEWGGNDFYTTRQAVAQGVAWDEAIVTFLDRAGDDVYEGGLSFSQGASAHNGLCLFIDSGGTNRFSYRGIQGEAGPNDYHDGTSLSVFVAADSSRNTYGEDVEPPQVMLNGEHGFVLDLPDSIDEAIETGSWRMSTRRE